MIGLAIIMLTISLIALPLNKTQAAGTTVQFVPQTSTVDAGTTFTINLTITDVTDLAVWEFRIFFLNTILNCTSAAKGPFLEKDGSSQFFTFTTYNTYNTTHGCVLSGASLLGAVPGVNGSGLLARITFKAVGGGDTQLIFDADPTWSFLKDSTPPPRHPIPYSTVDGTVHVAGSGPDITITSVSPAKNVLCQGYSVNINVTSTNNGGLTGTFNLTLYANATLIGNQTITLGIGSSQVTTFLWTTTGAPIGLHTIWVYAQPAAGETHVADNNFTDGSVRITNPGDIAAEFGTVDIFDVVLCALAFGAEPKSPNWNPIADINNDAIIDIFDIVVVAIHFA